MGFQILQNSLASLASFQFWSLSLTALKKWMKRNMTIDCFFPSVVTAFRLFIHQSFTSLLLLSLLQRLNWFPFLINCTEMKKCGGTSEEASMRVSVGLTPTCLFDSVTTRRVWVCEVGEKIWLTVCQNTPPTIIGTIYISHQGEPRCNIAEL